MAERKEAKIIYDGKNIKLYQDEVEQNDGSKNPFYILTVQSDTIGYFRDEKGSLAYGKRPAKALTFPEDKNTKKELKEAIGLLK